MQKGIRAALISLDVVIISDACIHKTLHYTRKAYMLFIINPFQQIWQEELKGVTTSYQNVYLLISKTFCLHGRMNFANVIWLRILKGSGNLSVTKSYKFLCKWNRVRAQEVEKMEEGPDGSWREDQRCCAVCLKDEGERQEPRSVTSSRG